MSAQRTYSVTQESIDAWAVLSGDRNPLHVDRDFAAGTRFGGTIAHGHFSLALIEDLVLETWGPAWLTGGTLRELRFKAPVRPGGTYRASLGVVEDGAARVEVRDTKGDALVIEGLAVPAAGGQA